MAKWDIHDYVQVTMIGAACALWIWILYALGTGSWS